MHHAILPVFLFTVCVIGLAVGLLLVAGLFNPGRQGQVMRMPYESGMDPIHDTRRRFDVHFHLLAIAFLAFDVELLFLYPWAVAMGGGGQIAQSGNEKSLFQPSSTAVGIAHPTVQHSAFNINHSPIPSSGIDAAVAKGLVESRHFVFAGAMVFLLLLTLGFVYDWRRGIFSWQRGKTVQVFGDGDTRTARRGGHQAG